MMDNGIITSLMVKEYMRRKEIVYTKVIFSMESTMDKEKWNIKMETDIKVHINMARKKGKEFIPGQMGITMTDNGKMIVHKGGEHP